MTAPVKNKPKILIADDNKDIVESLCERLEYEGFETIVAHEGVRAIELAHKEKPNLILLDIRMPAGTGQLVLKALRSHPDTSKIPVIVMTALKEKELEAEVADLGAFDFIQKPLDIDHLLTSIRALVGSLL